MKHDKCGTPDCCQECGPIQNKLNRYVQILGNIDGDQEKYLWIMDYGKNSIPMKNDYKVDEIEWSKNFYNLKKFLAQNGK